MKLKPWRTAEGYSPASAGFHFWCPGCDQPHAIRTEGAGDCWTFDGNQEMPTVRASVLTTRADPPLRCHLFITAGRVEFCSDSQHKLAGQTVPLPDWPEAWG